MHWIPWIWCRTRKIQPCHDLAEPRHTEQTWSKGSSGAAKYKEPNIHEQMNGEIKN